MVFSIRSSINEVCNANRVTSPTPWRRGNINMFSNEELPRTRDSFWRMAPRRNGGRREIWEALRQAAECQDLGHKQRILDVNNIRLGNRDMTLCFDDTGHRYEIPVYLLSDPTDMN